MDVDRPLETYRRLLARVSPFRFRLFVVAFSLLLTSGSTLAVPWFAKKFFHATAMAHESAAMMTGLLAIMFAAAGMGLGRFLAEDQLGWLSLRLLEEIRKELVAKVVRLSQADLQKESTGQLLARVMSDVQMLATFIYDTFFALGCDLLTVLGCVSFLLYLEWKLALLALLVVPLAAGLVGLTSRFVRRRHSLAQARVADMTSLLSEQLQGLSTIQAFGTEEIEVGRFSRALREHFEVAVTANRWQAGVRAAVNFLGVMAIVSVLGLGSTQIDFTGSADKGMTLDQLVGFSIYAAMLAEPLTRLSRTHFEIQRSLAAASRVFEILHREEPAEIGSQVLLRPLELPVQGNIRFSHVNFRYRANEPVLNDFSLDIRAGETIAIVGRSGAGKSTIASLLLRFREPSEGTIFLDSQPIQELSTRELRQHLGWVSQEPFLFRGTVAENIAYGSTMMTREAIERAAQLAHAHEFIEALPNGYDARLGERGVDLSGGQRARLLMARVIMRDPAVVILDESTAALDSDTEMKLWRDLKHWLSTRTTLLIAHRLTTILDCPRIVVLEAGRVVGDGNASQLQRNCDAFRRLFHEQMNLAPQAA